MVPGAANPLGGLKHDTLSPPLETHPVPGAANPLGGLKPGWRRASPRRSSPVPGAANPLGGLKLSVITNATKYDRSFQARLILLGD